MEACFYYLQVDAAAPYGGPTPTRMETNMSDPYARYALRNDSAPAGAMELIERVK